MQSHYHPPLLSVLAEGHDGDVIAFAMRLNLPTPFHDRQRLAAFDLKAEPSPLAVIAAVACLTQFAFDGRTEVFRKDACELTLCRRSLVA